jgi:hypothetical protein
LKQGNAADIIGIVLALAGSLWLSAALNVPFVFNGGIVLVAKEDHPGDRRHARPEN